MGITTDSKLKASQKMTLGHVLGCGDNDGSSTETQCMYGDIGSEIVW